MALRNSESFARGRERPNLRKILDFGFYFLETFINRLHFHDHARTPAIRRIVNRLVFVGRVIARVMDFYFDFSLFLRAINNTLAEIRVKNLRKNCDNMKSHKIFSDKSPTLVRRKYVFKYVFIFIPKDKLFE